MVQKIITTWLTHPPHPLPHLTKVFLMSLWNNQINNDPQENLPNLTKLVVKGLSIDHWMWK